MKTALPGMRALVSASIMSSVWSGGTSVSFVPWKSSIGASPGFTYVSGLARDGSLANSAPRIALRAKPRSTRCFSSMGSLAIWVRSAGARQPMHVGP